MQIHKVDETEPDALFKQNLQGNARVWEESKSFKDYADAKEQFVLYSLGAESRPAALLKLRDIVIGPNETAHELRQRIELPMQDHNYSQYSSPTRYGHGHRSPTPPQYRYDYRERYSEPRYGYYDRPPRYRTPPGIVALTKGKLGHALTVI